MTTKRTTATRRPKEKAAAVMNALMNEALQEALGAKEGFISVLGLSRKVAGVVFHEQFPHSGLLTIAAVQAALEKLPEAARKRIDVLDLAHNHLLKYDLAGVAYLLRLLPNVSEVDLSGCSLTTTRPDMILPFTRVKSLRRLYVFGTQLGMACAFDLYHNPTMEERDVTKIFFVKTPAQLEQGRWKTIVRPEHHDAVRAAHLLFFKETSPPEPSTPVPPASASVGQGVPGSMALIASDPTTGAEPAELSTPPVNLPRLLSDPTTPPIAPLPEHGPSFADLVSRPTHVHIVRPVPAH